MDEPEQNGIGRTRTIRLLGRRITMPQSRLLRIVIGGLLVFFGMFGFLPVLGFWMIPVGLIVLSYEFATVRRWRRRSEVWWAERRGRRRARRRQQFDASDRR
jgi:purine-cytosine permease-like protein